MQGGIGSVLSLTGAPNPNDTDHIEISLSTQYLEQLLGPASHNAVVSLSCMTELRIVILLSKIHDRV